jgi:hypothetical protein
MPENTTESCVAPGRVTGLAGQPGGRWATATRDARAVATYYRLRTVALEAEVTRLAAKVEARDRQLEETIARYEQILQDRPEDGTVSVTDDE